MSAESTHPESNLPAGLIGSVSRARPRWDTQAGRVIVAAVPFVALVGLWLLLSAYRPAGWQFAVPKFGPTMDCSQERPVRQWVGVASRTCHVRGGGSRVAHRRHSRDRPRGLDGSLAVGRNHPLPDRRASAGDSESRVCPDFCSSFFGYGISSKIALAVMVAFFPVLVNAVTGMRAARLDEIDLLRSMQALLGRSSRRSESDVPSIHLRWASSGIRVCAARRRLR